VTVLVVLGILALAGLGVLYMAARVVKAVVRFLAHFTYLWRFLSGQPMDGHRRHDGTFFKAPTKPWQPGAEKSWWHWRPGWHRSAMRLGALPPLPAIGAGLLLAPVLTLTLLAVTAAAGVLLGAWHVFYRIRFWRHERHHVRPLEQTLEDAVTSPPVSIDVQVTDGVVKQVAIEWAAEARIGPQEQEAVLQAVTARLPIEAPDPAWKLRGRNRSVVFTQSEPVRPYVSWEGDFAAAVGKAAADELVFGPGKRDAINAARYSQSPHLMIPGESGGGKSNLAAVLVLQEMLRGSLIFNLDPKWISHLWLQDLPNVINAHETADLHLALCWLGKELLRRTKAAYYSAGGTGRVRGNVGSRIIILCEELNYGMPGLKDHWREIREKDDPKQSPAISALSGLACAGRASDMHEWLIAQLMTVESTGVKDSTIRTNAGIKAMARWNGPGWAMAVGKHIPMPPPSTIPGRIQLVTGDSTRETQVPYLHLDDKDEEVAEAAVKWARELAVSGMVAQIPSGPEGIPPQLWPASVLGHDVPVIHAVPGGETHPRTAEAPEMMTLRSACAQEVLVLSLDAARKAAQRPGFPEIAGWDGPAALYYRAELTEWRDGKVRILR
jgi:hypothetical protein